MVLPTAGKVARHEEGREGGGGGGEKEGLRNEKLMRN